MDPWVESSAAAIAGRAERELEALVGVSSPSGDVPGAEEAAAICAALLPDDARVERPACSSPGHARDLIATVSGTGTGRVLLLGHVDTVSTTPPTARSSATATGSSARAWWT